MRMNRKIKIAQDFGTNAVTQADIVKAHEFFRCLSTGWVDFRLVLRAVSDFGLRFLPALNALQRGIAGGSISREPLSTRMSRRTAIWR